MFSVLEESGWKRLFMTDLSDTMTREHLCGLVWVGKRLLVLEGIG